MNKQEIFNKVATHLLAQNERCMSILNDEDNPGCAYRNEKGQMCAVGCLITDEAYDSKIEGLLCCLSEVLDVLAASGIDLRANTDRNCEMTEFLENLQRIHDCTPVDDWRHALSDLADADDLRMPEGI